MTEIKGIIKEVAGTPIYFSILVLGGLLVLYSLVYNPQYILSGFATLFYAIIGASVRLLYKDIRDYRYKKTPPAWLYAGYHIMQLMIIGLWVWVTVKYLFPYDFPILELGWNSWGYRKSHIFTEPGVIEWIGVIGTLILGALAIFGEQIRKSLFKANLMPIDVVKTEQTVGADIFVYQRLIVKNIGSAVAKEVRILLTYKNAAPVNFIPIPIAWTHWQKAARDISQHEPAYIDILRKKKGTANYDFCWPLETGTPYEELIRVFNPQHGDIRLELFEHDQQVGDITLEFSTSDDILKIRT